MRVEATLRDSLNRVTTRRTEGKIEKSRGLRTYIDMSRMIIDTVILKDRRISRSRVGNGIIMTMRIPITPKAIIELLLLANSVSQLPLTSDRAIYFLQFFNAM